MLPAAAIVVRCTLMRRLSGRGTSACALPSPVPSATATTFVACLCACAGDYLPSLARGSCAWQCRAANLSLPRHVVGSSLTLAVCCASEATLRLRRGSAASGSTLSSVSCTAARRLRGLFAASRMERSRRRFRVPDVSSQYLRRSHSACRRRTPTMYTWSNGFLVTA